MPKASSSVLIIRLDAIGDALALTPSIAALQRAGVPVDLVLRPANAAVFANGALRDVVVAGFDLRSRSRTNLAAIAQLGRTLRDRGYTHVLVATEDPGGYRLAAAIGAPVRAGFEDPWGKPLKAIWSRGLLTRSVYRSAALKHASAHECETLFGLVAPLAQESAPTRDLERLRPLVLDEAPQPDGRIVVQISDKWERLGIPFAQVVDLVRRVAAAGDVHLVASESETVYAERIEEATALPVQRFDALPPWKAAIAAADALIAPDSGALHVAGTIGTPVVAVFPPMPRFDAWVARWSPWAAPHRIVRAGDDRWPARATEALAQLR
ncbi:MAG TPA: glycosyltransferase family 9 protein [Candidatus Cybelea sp.]|nr:glycosyltransferase family 9 protein [Candidatus Cybelea sp.]